LVALIDQYAVFAFGNQSELDRGYVATTVDRDAIRVTYGLPVDDQDAAFRQGVTREVDVGMQGAIDYALQCRATRVIGVYDAGRPVLLGGGCFAGGDADHQCAQHDQLSHSLVYHGNMVLFVCHGDFGTSTSVDPRSALDLLVKSEASSGGAGQVPVSR
jgi:hypothetical protein